MKNYYREFFKKKTKVDILTEKIDFLTEEIFQYNFSYDDIAIIVDSIKEKSLIRLESQKEHLENELKTINNALNKLKNENPVK